MWVVKITHLISLAIIFYDFNKVTAFFANDLWKCAGVLLENDAVEVSHDLTHESIIRKALNNIRRQTNDSTQDETLGDNYRFILEDLTKGSNDVEQYLSHLSAYHFNAEQILEGNSLIENLTSQLSVLPSHCPYTRTVGRYISGVILHLIHDFYSNTDYPEMNPGETFDDLGTEAGYNNLGVDTEGKEGFCVSQPAGRKQGNIGNIFHATGWITSGYRSDQDIEKPPGWVGAFGLVGKCSHGGDFDLSARRVAPTGGMNKESRSYLFSPHFKDHEDAALSAVKHSEQFLQTLHENILRHSDPILSFINTPALHKLIGSDKWAEFISRYKMLTRYSAIRVYDKYGSQEFKTLKDMSISAIQDRIVEEKLLLETILHLPERAVLIIISDANRPLGHQDIYSEQLIQKTLIVKQIKLISIVRADSESISRSDLKRISDRSGGQMYFYTEYTDVLHVLYYTPFHLDTAQFINNTDTIAVSVPGSTSSILSINCFYKPLQSPTVEIIRGAVTVSFVASPPAITIFNITTTDSELGVLHVQLPKHSYRHEKCDVLVFTSKKQIHVKPVIEGLRKQLFINSQRATKGSRMSVLVREPTIRPDSITVAYNRKLETCSHENTSQLYISETLPFDLPPNHHIIVNYKVAENSFKLKSFVSTQSISIVLPYIVDLRLVNTSTSGATVTVRNKWDYVDYQITVMMDNSRSGLTLQSKEFKLSHNETRNVSIDVEQVPEYISSDVIISPAFLILKGIGISDDEFYEVMPFYVLSYKPDLPPPTTTIPLKTVETVLTTLKIMVPLTTKPATPLITLNTTLVTKTTPNLATILLPTTPPSTIKTTPTTIHTTPTIKTTPTTIHTTPPSTIKTTPTTIHTTPPSTIKTTPTTIYTTPPVTTVRPPTKPNDAGFINDTIDPSLETKLTTTSNTLTMTQTSKQAPSNNPFSSTSVKSMTINSPPTNSITSIFRQSTTRPSTKTPSETYIMITESTEEVISDSQPTDTSLSLRDLLLVTLIPLSVTIVIVVMIIVLVFICKRKGACRKGEKKANL